MLIWRNLSIRTKVVAAFASTFLVMLALGLFGMAQTGSVNDRAVEVRDNWLPSTSHLGRLLGAVETTRVIESRVVRVASAGKAEEYAEAVTALQNATAATDSAYQEYLPFISPGTKDETLMRDFTQEWARYKQNQAAVLARVAAKDIAGADALYLNPGRETFNTAATAVLDDLKFNEQEGKAAADRGEATFQSSRTWTVAALAAGALLCILAGLAVITSVVSPLRVSIAAVNSLAAGNLETAVSDTTRKDEIGDLARALEVFKRNAAESKRLGAAQEAERLNKERRAEHLAGLVQNFEATVGSTVGTLAAGATQLEMTSQSMSTSAVQTRQRAATVTAAADQAGASVQTVAAAAEQLTSSIVEISRQISQSNQITVRAVSDAQRTDTIVQALAQGAEKIGHVVGLISNIASQTNLLALNATIEGGPGRHHQHRRRQRSERPNQRGGRATARRRRRPLKAGRASLLRGQRLHHRRPRRISRSRRSHLHSPGRSTRSGNKAGMNAR